MKPVFKITLLLIFVFGSLKLSAQITNDLSRVQVSQLSDEQVRTVMNKMFKSGASIQEIEQEAKARGMKASEIALFSQRIKHLKEQDLKNVKLPSTNSTTPVSTENLEAEDQFSYVYTEADPRGGIYGMSLFSKAVPQFTPNLNLATPVSYTIGVGDILDLNLYGDSEANYTLVVNKEGHIQIPYVGSIAVSGMSIETLRAKLKTEMSKVYSGLAYGSTMLGVTLGEVRSIQVILSGEVAQPGSYTLPSVATAFNALYQAGGPTSIGNLREIRIIRNGKLLAELDVYEFMQTGSLLNNPTLQDQDVVQVSAYKNRVQIEGEVKRPLFFDLKDGESFADLLNYAGGFTDKAYKARVQVDRVTLREKSVADLLESQFSQFQPQNGDKFIVSELIERYENRIELFGAVYKPGVYELTPGLTVSMLLQKSDGLQEDAFLKLAYIDRLKDNLEVERISFNIANVLAGVERDIELKREDKIYISSIFDLRDAYQVQILGEVRRPGVYNYSEGMQIHELILQAGGFTDAASPTRIEVSRRVTSANKSDASLMAETFTVDLTKDLEYLSNSLVLQPFDLIAVRTELGFETQKNVRIEGEVQFPGIYTIKSKDERVSDLIARAGGLTQYAYAKGASLQRGLKKDADLHVDLGRISKADEFEQKQLALQKVEQEARFDEMQEDAVIGEVKKSIRETNMYVGIELDKLLRDPKLADNIFLEDGDVLFVPKQLQTVKISGEVLSPVTTVYRPKQKFKYYLSNAGGFTERSLKRRSYVVYANGSTAKANSFLGIKSYPAIEPGAEIFVPEKQLRQPMSPQAWIGMGTGFASLAAIILSIFK